MLLPPYAQHIAAEHESIDASNRGRTQGRLEFVAASADPARSGHLALGGTPRDLRASPFGRYRLLSPNRDVGPVRALDRQRVAVRVMGCAGPAAPPLSAVPRGVAPYGCRLTGRESYHGKRPSSRIVLGWTSPYRAVRCPPCRCATAFEVPVVDICGEWCSGPNRGLPLKRPSAS